MRPALIRLLACPRCGGDLELDATRTRPAELSEEDETRLEALGRDREAYTHEVEEGTLTCVSCSDRYPVRRGVPRFTGSAESDVKSVQSTYTDQWSVFDFDSGRIWHWSIEDRMKSFLFELDAEPAELEGKLVLDGGCGSGIIISQVAERFGAEVVGLDLSNAVEVAQQRKRSALCHFVQGSVLEPPLKRASLDVVYSHGVLMMTPDTHAAFRALARLARPGAKVYLWVYGKKSGWPRVKFWIVDGIRFAVNRMPSALQRGAVAVLAAISQAVQWVKQRRGTATVPMPIWSQAKAGVRDRYTHRYRREHTEAEVRGWFAEAGIVGLSARQEMPGAPWTENTVDIGILGTVPDEPPAPDRDDALVASSEPGSR